MEAGLGEGRDLADFVSQAERSWSRRSPAIGTFQRLDGHDLPRIGTDQPDARRYRTIILHEARRRDYERGASGLPVEHQPRFRVGLVLGENLIACRDLGSIFAQERHQRRRGATRLMGRDDLLLLNHEALGPHGLNPDIEGPGLHSAFDRCLHQALEDLEELVLERDRQSEDAIEEGRDGRKLFQQAAIPICEIEPRCRFETRKRARLDPAGIDQLVKLAERQAAIDGFEIVLGPEHALAAGLALSPRDRPERVETPGNRRQKPLLALHIARHGTEERRLCLIGPVGAPQPLDRVIRLPAGFQQVMHAQALVLRRTLGVIARPVPPASEKTRIRF